MKISMPISSSESILEELTAAINRIKALPPVIAELRCNPNDIDRIKDIVIRTMPPRHLPISSMFGVGIPFKTSEYIPLNSCMTIMSDRTVKILSIDKQKKGE